MHTSKENLIPRYLAAYTQSIIIGLRDKLFTTNMVWDVNSILYTTAKPLSITCYLSPVNLAMHWFHVGRLEIYKQHHNTHMLPTMWAQKLNKLDNSNFLKGRIGIDSEKVCKKYGKTLKIELKGYYA